MAPRRTRPPADKPITLTTPQLSLLPEKTPGRPKKRVQPPVPAELLNALSDLEKDWYWYFVDTIQEEYPDLTQLDLIQVYTLLAPCFISCMRLETKQMDSQELITMARQDPRSQFNQLMNSLSVRRRDRKVVSKEDDADKWLMGLSG